MDITKRINELQAEMQTGIYRTTDRLFLWLMVVQVLGGIIAATILGPRTYSGSQSFIHPHVVFATVLGLLIAAPVIVTVCLWPGTKASRFTVAVCQPLMSALLIHVSGGRIETHFHVFGSLAFLAFYRDWKILVPATLVVALDHMIRGVYAPQSVYGLVAGAQWRFLEHAGWVIFEDVILVASCVRGVREIRMIAERRAQLETTNARIEETVIARTNELRQTELRNSAVLANALDAIVSVDRNGKITEFNPSAESVFGLSVADACNLSLWDLFAEGSSKDLIESCFGDESATVRETLDGHLELLGRKSGGEEFPIELAMSFLSIKGSTVCTAFIRDSSERKKLESKVAQSNKLQSLGSLATGVAHEINTPSQYVGDNVRYINENFGVLTHLIEDYRALLAEAEEGNVDPATVEKIRGHENEADLEFLLEEIPQALTQAIEGVDRVSNIVHAMKEFAHTGIESITMVELNRVISSTVMVARNEWKYGAKIELNLMEDLPPIQGNPGELGQVVLNLVVNAAHAIRDHYQDGTMGLIKISTKAEGDEVVLVVKDDGSGIPKEVQERMFDPFFTTKGVGIGTGQGLAIVHSVVVDRHGGEIEVNSAVGEGTEILIRLPISGCRAASESKVA